MESEILGSNVGLDVINKIRIRNFEYRTEDEIDRTEFGGSSDDKKYTVEEASEHEGTSEGDYYKNYGIDKSGVQLGIGADIKASIAPRADKSFSTYIYYAMTLGATRLEEKKIVEIACDPSAGIT